MAPLQAAPCNVRSYSQSHCAELHQNQMAVLQLPVCVTARTVHRNRSWCLYSGHVMVARHKAESMRQLSHRSSVALHIKHHGTWYSHSMRPSMPGSPQPTLAESHIIELASPASANANRSIACIKVCTCQWHMLLPQPPDDDSSLRQLQRCHCQDLTLASRRTPSLQSHPAHTASQLLKVSKTHTLFR